MGVLKEFIKSTTPETVQVMVFRIDQAIQHQVGRDSDIACGHVFIGVIADHQTFMG